MTNKQISKFKRAVKKEFPNLRIKTKRANGQLYGSHEWLNINLGLSSKDASLIRTVDAVSQLAAQHFPASHGELRNYSVTWSGI